MEVNEHPNPQSVSNECVSLLSGALPAKMISSATVDTGEDERKVNET